MKSTKIAHTSRTRPVTKDKTNHGSLAESPGVMLEFFRAERWVIDSSTYQQLLYVSHVG